MSLILQAIWFQKLKAFLDFAWALSCLTCVPALVVTTAFWLVGPQSRSATIFTKTEAVVHAQAGELANVNSNVQMKIEAEKKVYRMKLYDSSGKLMYTYPDLVPEQGEDPEIGNVMIQVPNGTPAGEYQLYVDVIYPMNPLKTNTLTARVATITVDGGR